MTQAQRPQRARTTLHDVASRARVDKSVVSRVVNGDDRLVIKQETRQRVLDAIRELGYHTNAAARSLRTAQSGTLGLLIPDFANPIYAEIIKGAEQEATEQGALLLTGTAFEDRPQRYVEMLASGRVEGLLLAADRLDSATIEALLATGHPVVSVNQRIKGLRYAVLADDKQASKLAVRHLLELGHVRIAHMHGPATSDTAKRRRAGYLEAMRAAGLPVLPGYLIGSDYTSEGGYEAMHRLMTTAPRPTAVVVANIAAAIGALTAVRVDGFHVPQDVSVIAIHDIALAANLAPPLTTVRMPLAEMGRAGVRALLFGEAANPGRLVVRQPTELIVRRSTAPPTDG